MLHLHSPLFAVVHVMTIKYLEQRQPGADQGRLKSVQSAERKNNVEVQKEKVKCEVKLNNKSVFAAAAALFRAASR